MSCMGISKSGFIFAGFFIFLSVSGYGFLPSNRFLTRTLIRDQKLHASKEKTTFNSKLMTDVSPEELEELFKEFNITNFDLKKDEELNKWLPTKEFFELYGFQNNTEKYRRKTMDVKIDFYNNYRKPILPQYKTFIADIMAMTFVQSIDSRYKYDALHAFGICTQYYTIMKGYPLQDEVSFASFDRHSI